VPHGRFLFPPYFSRVCSTPVILPRFLDSFSPTVSWSSMNCAPPCFLKFFNLVCFSHWSCLFSKQKKSALSCFLLPPPSSTPDRFSVLIFPFDAPNRTPDWIFQIHSCSNIKASHHVMKRGLATLPPLPVCLFPRICSP